MVDPPLPGHRIVRPEATSDPVDEQDAGAPPIPCPACGAPLYGWAVVPTRLGPRRVIDRCEECGLLVTRTEGPVDVTAELGALGRGPGEYAAPNRRSVQAGLGGAQWAAIDPARRLHLTPRSATLLLARLDLEVGSIRYPRRGPNLRWMWQTLLNGLTFNLNFATELLAGRIRPRGTGERIKVAIDLIVTALAALPAALLAIPLEIASALLRRGGLMVLEARPRAVEADEEATAAGGRA
jgi:hypothetical protein